MELAEYETQVIKSHETDVSITDVLDEYILKPNQSFQPPDLTNLIEDCSDLVYKNNEFKNQLNGNDLASLLNTFEQYKEDLDNQAFKISENKQSYINNKKNLATKIRNTNEILAQLSAVDDENIRNVKEF